MFVLRLFPDLSFLNEVGRSVCVSSRDPKLKGTPLTGSPFSAPIHNPTKLSLQRHAKDAGINLLLMSTGLTRAKINTSKWNQKYAMRYKRQRQ